MGQLGSKPNIAMSRFSKIILTAAKLTAVSILFWLIVFMADIGLLYTFRWFGLGSILSVLLATAIVSFVLICIVEYLQDRLR